MRHESEQHGLCFSEVAGFELAEGGYEVLELELLPATTLRGELEQTVPRPIEAGHVLVVMTHGGVGRAPVLRRSFEAPVEPDGTFAVEGLPPGGGYVFALCRGWSSMKTRADSAEQVGLQLFASERDPRSEAERLEEALDGMGERAKAHQRVRIPQARAPYVVLMEQAGSVEVQVEHTDGRPVAGATVSINPNVHVATVGSWIVPWRDWRRESDSAGRARFEDVPPGGTVWASAHHQELQMRKEDREQHIRVEIRPGETTQARVVLEPK